MEQAVALLHSAKEAPAAEKNACFEQFLQFIRGVNAAPGYFDELLPLITEEFMGEEETRHFVPQFVEEACRRQKAFIPMCTATISDLSRDDNPTVLSKTMRAVGVLFRKALIAICSDDGDVAEEYQADMWETVREAAVTLRQHSRHDHALVRNSAVMLLQVLANILAVPDDGEGEGDDEEDKDADETFSLHSIPPCHALLDYSELKRFGQECLQQLMEVVDVEKGAPFQTITLAINCLGRAARQNPHLIVSIDSVLTKASDVSLTKKMGLIKWESASIRSTVKSTLLALLKLPRCAAYAALLVERLSSLGAVTQAEAARRIMEKARSQYARAPGSKRPASSRQVDPRLAQRGDAIKRARIAEAPLIPLSRIPQGKPPEEWEPELVSELILAAMINLPPALPPHLIDVADTPLSMWPERLAHPGAHAKADARDAADKGEEGEGSESAQTATAIRNKALMSAKPLPKATMKALADDALLRLLDGESSGWSARTKVVAQLMASSDIGGEELEDALVQHLLQHYALRHPLAIQYLHQIIMQESMAQARAEPAASSKTKTNRERYTLVLHRLVDGLMQQAAAREAESAADTQRLLTKLLADAPLIDDGTMNRVSKLCDDDDKQMRQVGMSCLRALIVHQQAWRTECLRRLLKCTVAKDEAIRSPAIRLVANKLFGLKYLTNQIRQFAINNLRKACQLSHDNDDGDTIKSEAQEAVNGREAGAEGEVKRGDGEVVRHYMHLFMALCAQKHELLHALIETYVQATPGVRSAVQASITDMIKAIGAESPVLLSIIGDLPKGAELLLLAFVRTLTEHGNPGQYKKLLDAIKTLYARIGDARFMIYICSALSRTEVEELLPHMVVLPQIGVKAALHRLLHSRVTPLTPEKLMVALHKIEPNGKQLTMKKIAEAIELCFNHRTVFTTQVLAVVVQQLLDQNPLPELYMRTVLLALKASPSLTDFVMGILQRLISKQIWSMPTLWKGFVKCCRHTLPRSLAVLVQLPPNQLSKAVQECQELGPPLALYIKDQMAQGYNVPAQIVKIVEPWMHGDRAGARRQGGREGERGQAMEEAGDNSRHR